MSGSYPDGVTGAEYAIAGADGNTDIGGVLVYCNNEDCEMFDEEQSVDIIDAEYYRHEAWGYWDCEHCGTKDQEWEGYLPEDDDYPED